MMPTYCTPVVSGVSDSARQHEQRNEGKQHRPTCFNAGVIGVHLKARIKIMMYVTLGKEFSCGKMSVDL